MKQSFDKGFVTPHPVFIVATYDENGKANAMNAAWVGQVGGNQFGRLGGQGVPVRFLKGPGMRVGQGDTRLGRFSLAQGVKTPDDQGGLAGSDDIGAMLAVAGQGLIQEQNAAESRGRQSDEPVVHEHLFRGAVGQHPVRQRPVQQHGTAGSVVLH